MIRTTTNRCGLGSGIGPLTSGFLFAGRTELVRRTCLPLHRYDPAVQTVRRFTMQPWRSGTYGGAWHDDGNDRGIMPRSGINVQIRPAYNDIALGTVALLAQAAGFM